MPRYIDADALTENINNLSVMLCRKELFGELAKHSVTQMIDEHPTADVVPVEVVETLKDNNEHLSVMLSEAKQDVARKICCEIEEEIVAALENNYKVRSDRFENPHVDMADEFIAYVEGKIAAFRGVEGFVEELKKKYTEEKA